MKEGHDVYQNVEMLMSLLRPVPRALKGGPSDRQHLFGVDREDSKWAGDGLPNVGYRRTLRFGHLCSQCTIVCGFSLQRWHVGLSNGRTP